MVDDLRTTTRPVECACRGRGGGDQVTVSDDVRWPDLPPYCIDRVQGRQHHEARRATANDAVPITQAQRRGRPIAVTIPRGVRLSVANSLPGRRVSREQHLGAMEVSPMRRTLVTTVLVCLLALAASGSAGSVSAPAAARGVRPPTWVRREALWQSLAAGESHPAMLRWKLTTPARAAHIAGSATSYLSIFGSAGSSWSQCAVTSVPLRHRARERGGSTWCEGEGPHLSRARLRPCPWTPPGAARAAPLLRPAAASR